MMFCFETIASMSFMFIRFVFELSIKTFEKLLFCNRFKTAVVFLYLIKWFVFIECMLGEPRLGRLGEPLGGSWGGGACSHLPALQDIE